MSRDFTSMPTYPVVPLSPPFEDKRGAIQNLFTNGMASGALIVSKAGSRRADHWHKTGNHLCVLINGKLIYKWRPVGDTNPPKVLTLDASLGPVAFYTPPNLEHSMEFLVDSVFLSFDSKVERSHQGYEDDLVRLATPLI